MVQLASSNDRSDSKNPMTQVVNSARLIATFLGCLLFGQSILPLAVYGASEMRSGSGYGANEASDILGVRSNVDRIIELQAAGGAPSEELLWNKAIVLKQILLGYLEVRQTSDLLDEAVDETYDSIDKQVRSVNRRVELVNTINFTTFGILFNTAAADRLKKNFAQSNILTWVSASLTAGLGAVAVGLAYTGSPIDRCRPNPLAAIFGLDKASVPLPELVSKYIDGSTPGKTQSRRSELLDLWKTKFGVHKSSASEQVLSAESPKRHHASLHLLNQRLALLFSLNALVEQFDSELLSLLRAIESTSVPTTDGSTLAANDQLGAPGLEAAKLLGVERCAATIINVNRTSARNGADLQTLALDLFVLEKILGAALEVRQVVDRVDREKHYQFDILLPQLVRVRDRVNLLTNTATFTEIGVLKNIAAEEFHTHRNNAGNTTLMAMDAIAVLLSTANLAYLKLYHHKQESPVNILANIFKIDPNENQFSSLIFSYLESVPPGSVNGHTRKQQLIDHWKLTDKHRTAEALSSSPSMHGKRVETIDLVNRRVQMLFDVRGIVETLDTGLLQLLTAVILPPSERLADNRVDKQLAVIKRTLHNALEVRSASDEIDNQLSLEYAAKGAILGARSRAIQYNNILNFAQSGTLGVISQSCALRKQAVPAETLNLVSGSLVLLLSSIALLQQHGGKRPSKPELNVLAQVLVPGTTKEACIPPSVMQYFNTSDAANGMTRRELLIERWRKSGVIMTNLKNEGNLSKLSASTQTSEKESVRLITDRIVMLHDVKTEIESMDTQLVKTLKEGAQPPAAVGN